MIGDDPIEIMARLRRVMGDLDRAVIDLRRLEIGAPEDVRAAAAPAKAIAADLANSLQHLLQRLENAPEYKLEKRTKDGSVG